VFLFVSIVRGRSSLSVFFVFRLIFEIKNEISDKTTNPNTDKHKEQEQLTHY